jgi:predicted murein hydrolase (TIGR00659 family)
MSGFFTDSVYFGVAISLAAYEIGRLLQARFRLAVLNPLLIAIALTLGTVALLEVDYESYYNGAKYLSYLLTPATVSLAVPLYEQVALLKRNARALAAGILSGIFASLASVLILAKLFRLSHVQYVTLLPKSITTAIGMGVSESLGGLVPVTAAVIIITGILGNVLAEGIFRLFGIRARVAKGLALGTAAHAIGTARAMEIGEVEGAMSSLAITVCGILTAAAASFFARLM